MGEKEYVWEIRPGLDRFRYHHRTEGKDVIEFVLQYEAYIEEKWREIVRYDTAHNRPHRDILYPDGTQTKDFFPYWSNAETMTFGERDIKLNWRRYRRAYEEKMKK